MLAKIVSILIAFSAMLLRLTCRVTFHNDPRPTLRGRGETFIFSFLHAHQLGLVIGGERGACAMVSRSRDGELIVLLLKMIGCVPVRGSKRVDQKDRGGRAAIHTLVNHVTRGRPAAIAVDGPRGPRGRVHKGIALLSQQTGAPVLNIVAISKHKWIVAKAWDRMQIPLPFTHLDGYFSEPIYPQADEKLETYRQRIEASLQALEARHEPDEAAHNYVAVNLDHDSYCEDIDHADDDSITPKKVA